MRPLSAIFDRLLRSLDRIMIFLFLGQARPHLSSVLLLQLVLSCGIVAGFPLLLAFLSPFFFLGIIALDGASD